MPQRQWAQKAPPTPGAEILRPCQLLYYRSYLFKIYRCKSTQILINTQKNFLPKQNRATDCYFIAKGKTVIKSARRWGKWCWWRDVEPRRTFIKALKTAHCKKQKDRFYTLFSSPKHKKRLFFQKKRLHALTFDFFCSYLRLSQTYQLHLYSTKGDAQETRNTSKTVLNYYLWKRTKRVAWLRVTRK